MTTVKFIYDNKKPIGFEISGHATSSAKDSQGKIVCSAVSSSAYMAANTITDIIKAKCDVYADYGSMRLKLLEHSPQSETVLQGLILHLTELSKQYKNFITISEDK